MRWSIKIKLGCIKNLYCNLNLKNINFFRLDSVSHGRVQKQRWQPESENCDKSFDKQV